MTVIKVVDRNPVHVVHRDLPGTESAAQLGYPKCQQDI